MAIPQAQDFYKETVSTAWAAGAGNFYVSNKPTNSEGYLVLSPSNASLREIVKYTAIGTDGGGDFVTLTAPNRGLGGTTDQTHVVGESVFMNVTAEHIDDIIAEVAAKLDDNQLDTDGTLAADSDTKIATQKATKTYADTKMSKTGDETVAGIKTFSSSPIVPAPTTDLQAATKKYADDLAIAGAPDASETVKGLVEIATQTEVDAGTDTGGTGAKVAVIPSTLQQYVADELAGFTIPTPKSCRVYHSTSQSLTSLVALAFDSENFDADGFHDTVTNNTRITVPPGGAGKYMIGASFQNVNTNPTVIKLRLNGTTDIAFGHGEGHSGSLAGSHISTIYDLADADYIEVFGQGGSMSALGGVQTTFWVVEIV